MYRIATGITTYYLGLPSAAAEALAVYERKSNPVNLDRVSAGLSRFNSVFYSPKFAEQIAYFPQPDAAFVSMDLPALMHMCAPFGYDFQPLVSYLDAGHPQLRLVVATRDDRRLSEIVGGGKYESYLRVDVYAVELALNRAVEPSDPATDWRGIGAMEIDIPTLAKLPARTILPPGIDADPSLTLHAKLDRVLALLQGSGPELPSGAIEAERAREYLLTMADRALPDKPWFAWDWDGEFSFFATEAEAVADAQLRISSDRVEARKDDWHQTTGYIKVGRIYHQAKPEYYDNGSDPEIVYQLTPISEQV